MKAFLTISLCLVFCAVKPQITYYISSSGNDANSGMSPSSPKKTIPLLTPKNSYLFNRGDTFYNKIGRVYNPAAGNIITVGAYGTGVKPVLSLYAKILSSGWEKDVTNVWKVNFTNPANLSGSATGITADIGFLRLNGLTIMGAKKSAKSALASQWDFYSDTTYLYVYSISKPSLLASLIQASTSNNAISISDNMTVQDIQIIGAGHHALSAFHQKNIIIRNVDIREIGGCYLGGYGNGRIRYGNGVQLFNGGINNLIEGCTIKQVYDVALTMQTANSTSLWLFRDITFRNNLVDSCDQGFENTLSTTNMNLDSSGYINCRIVNNNFRNAGYGWSYSLRPHPRGATLITYQWHTTKNDLIFEGNTFYKARNGLYYSSDGSGSVCNIPPYISRNNNIWLNTNTSIRMKEDSYSLLFTWTIGNYQNFVNATGKEIGSTWHNLDSQLNIAPKVNITTPVGNAIFNAPASITVSAIASDADGKISKVEFYNGTTLLTTERYLPYSFVWGNVAAGNYTITAKATDNSGTSTISSAINIKVYATTIAAVLPVQK